MWTKRIAVGVALAGALTAGAGSAAFAAPAESTAQALAAPGWHKVDEWPTDSYFWWDICYYQASVYRQDPEVRATECRWAAPHNIQLWIRTEP
jgi:hypothetical protein